MMLQPRVPICQPSRFRARTAGPRAHRQRGCSTPAAIGSMQRHAAATAEATMGTPAPLADLQTVYMHVRVSTMGISFWPSFSFKPPEREPRAGQVSLLLPEQGPAGETATGAAAAGDAAASPQPSPRLHITFTPAGQPPDEFRVGATFLGGLPFPFITIRTTKLEGLVDTATGEVTLDFEAKFLAGLGDRPPTELTVNTRLTTERTEAYGVARQGQRLQGGDCTLVAAAPVPKTGYFLADLILWLPTAATAQLPMRLEFLTAEQAAGAGGDGRQKDGDEAGEQEAGGDREGALVAAPLLGAGVAQRAASVVPAPSGLRQAPAVDAPAGVGSKVG